MFEKQIANKAYHNQNAKLLNHLYNVALNENHVINTDEQALAEANRIVMAFLLSDNNNLDKDAPYYQQRLHDNTPLALFAFNRLGTEHNVLDLDDHFRLVVEDTKNLHLTNRYNNQVIYYYLYWYPYGIKATNEKLDQKRNAITSDKNSIQAQLDKLGLTEEQQKGLLKEWQKADKKVKEHK